MKSFVKKTATLFLGISFAFTGVACAVPEDESKGPGGTTIVAANYVQGVTQQIEEAKGAKITIDGEFSETVNGVDLTIDVDGSLTFALTEKGWNAALDVSASAGGVVIREAKALYLDGCIYMYEDDLKSYIFFPVYAPTDTALEMMIESLTENILGTPISYSAIQSVLTKVGENLPLGDGSVEGNEFNPEQAIAKITEFIQENGTLQEDSKLLVSKEYSVKEDLSSIVAAINGIDESATSIESFLDTYVLPMIDPDLKFADLIGLVSSVASLKVADAYNAVNSFLTLNYGKGLQDVWDQAMKNELVKNVLGRFLSPEKIAELSVLKFDEVLQTVNGDKAVGEYTLFEVAKYLYNTYAGTAYVTEPDDGGEEETESTPTVQEQIDEFFAMIKKRASETTLAAAGIMLPAWDDLTITAAKAVGEMNFGADYKLISAKAGVEFGVTGLPVKDGETDASALSAKLYVGVEEISSVAAEIALPEGASTIFSIGIPLEGTGLDGYTSVVSARFEYAIVNDAVVSTNLYFNVDVKNAEGIKKTYTFEAEIVSELTTKMTLKNMTGEGSVEVTFDFQNGTADLSGLAAVVEADFAPAAPEPAEPMPAEPEPVDPAA